MRISVVVTCFNYGKFLSACLDSILAQTYRDFDVIVVDDGSTDDTAQVIRPYLTDTRIRYHYQPNLGQAAAKNAGVRLSEGEIVAFLDADDVWMPTKLALQVPLFDRPEVGVTFTGHSAIDPHGRALPMFVRRGYMKFRRGRVTEWLGFENIVPFSSSAVRRTLLEQHGAFDEALGMGIDWDLWLRLSCVTEFDFVPNKLFAYRVGHPNQMSRDAGGRVRASDAIFRKFLTNHPGAFSADALKAIEYYNSCSRGHGVRSTDLARSTQLFQRARVLKPLSYAPYLNLLRNHVIGYWKGGPRGSSPP